MLGSGPVFADEAHCKRDLAINSPRIEAWRETQSYELHRQVSLSSSFLPFSSLFLFLFFFFF